MQAWVLAGCQVGGYLPSTRLYISEDHLVDFAVRTSVSVSKWNHLHLPKVMFTLHIWLGCFRLQLQEPLEGHEQRLSTGFEYPNNVPMIQHIC
jgi:hypothetical protein